MKLFSLKPQRELGSGRLVKKKKKKKEKDFTAISNELAKGGNIAEAFHGERVIFAWIQNTGNRKINNSGCHKTANYVCEARQKAWTLNGFGMKNQVS